jgi:ornithine cyclodeaminase/alanine dehydrogenase-like protein (mu-crystallin family)
VLGEDHRDTLASASNLAADLRALGDHQAARELDEDTLARSRRALGEDHPDTLASADNLAADLRELGDHQAARELDEDTLARGQRGKTSPGQ